MICFCDSCSSLSGIGAPFLYLWCIARVTNYELMQTFNEVNRRIDSQDETLKSIQSSLVELTSAMKALGITQGKKEVIGDGSDAPLIVDGEESDEQLKNVGEEGESSSAIKGENEHIRQEGSRLPPVNNASAGREFSKPVPDSSERADNVSKEPKLVSTFDSNSKESNDHLHPAPSKSEQGMESHDGVKRKQVWDNGGKAEDNNHTCSSSITTYDICPKKANTGVKKLKPSILVMNKEKRLQSKRPAEGPIINILRPGMVLLKGYISYNDQVKIVKTCMELGMSEGGFYQPKYNNEARLQFRMMCLGINWELQSRHYTHTRACDDSKPQKIPEYFHEMVKKAIQDSDAYIQKNAGISIPSMSPDTCIAKLYTQGGKLGLHQDKVDEGWDSFTRSGLRVGSFSIGDTAEVLYGKERDIDKAEEVKLESGDVLIFSGESRHIFHGVSSMEANTTPVPVVEGTDMRQGRLNLTFRKCW